MPDVTMVEKCRACGNGDVAEVGSLGPQYPSAFLRPGDDPGPLVPIELVRCGTCDLVQQRYSVSLERLHRGRYWYKSGVTKTMRDSLAALAAEAARRAGLTKGDVVLDLGSNDGTLLRSYPLTGLIRVGVEPAPNLWDEGAVGVDLLVREAWSHDAYLERMWGLSSETFPRSSNQAKVITAVGMLYDLEDPLAFLTDLGKALRPDGIACLQLMCLRNMIRVGDVGNLCHEHLEFYSLASLGRLLGRAGLEVYDGEVNDTNGESYRLWCRHKSVVRPRTVGRVTNHDRDWTLHDDLADFFREAENNKQRVVRLITGLAAEGKKVWLYGASTKGNTLLQYWGLGFPTILGAAERSPEKWGRRTVGTNVPIHAEDEGRAEADVFLALPYTFRDEFLAREADWRARGGKFVFPLPKLEVV